MYIYPLLCVDLPEFCPGNGESQRKRDEAWRSLEARGAVDFLLRSGGPFRAFDINEFDFNYCNLAPIPT